MNHTPRSLQGPNIACVESVEESLTLRGDANASAVQQGALSLVAMKLRLR